SSKQETAPRAARVDCQKLLRHLVAVGGVTPADLPEGDARLLQTDPEKFYATRCADRAYASHLNELPPEHVECLLRARGSADVDACIATRTEEQLAADREAEAAAEAKEFDCSPPVQSGGTAALAGTVRDAKEVLAGVTVVVKSRSGEAQ